MINKIELKNISKKYLLKKKILVLKNINFKFKAGKIYSLMGPSGSGKSTLIRCINRLEEHQQGSIIVDDIELYQVLKKFCNI